MRKRHLLSLLLAVKQWGFVTRNFYANASTIPFSLPFASAVCCVIANVIGGNGDDVSRYGHLAVEQYSLTGIRLRNNFDASRSAFWYATGT